MNNPNSLSEPQQKVEVKVPEWLEEWRISNRALNRELQVEQEIVDINKPVMRRLTTTTWKKHEPDLTQRTHSH